MSFQSSLHRRRTKEILIVVSILQLSAPFFLFGKIKKNWENDVNFYFCIEFTCFEKA